VSAEEIDKMTESSSSLAKALYDEINILRRCPMEYAAWVEDFLKNFVDEKIYVLDGKKIQSKKGKKGTNPQKYCVIVS
jgi:hypothetical protein